MNVSRYVETNQMDQKEEKLCRFQATRQKMYNLKVVLIEMYMFLWFHDILPIYMISTESNNALWANHLKG